MERLIEKFWDWVDSRAVIRRVVMIFTLYMTYYVTHEAFTYAATSKLDGLGIAAVLSAITVPYGLLAGFTFKWYTDSRS